MTQPKTSTHGSTAAWAWRVGWGVIWAALVVGCGDNSPKEAVAPPPPQVKVVQTRAETVPVTNSYVGRISAYRSVEVQARVQGIVQKRLFTEGTDVKKGQLLYLIDPSEYQQSVQDARASLAKAEADLVNAAGRASRYAPLAKEEAISQQDYDDAVSNKLQAEAVVDSAKATLESAKINLGYTRVLATENGRIGETLVPEGRLVGRDGPTQLAVIDRIDQVYVSFTLSDRDALELRRSVQSGRIQLAGATSPGGANPPAAKVRVLLPDGSDYRQGGEIDFASQSVNPDTGTITVRGVLPNPQRELLPGMFVQVRLSVGVRPNAILIPQQAVIKTPTGHVAWVVGTDGEAERRDLLVGPWYGEQWVIDKGLVAGEMVVVDGVQKLRPGLKVAASPVAPSGPTAAPASMPAASAPRQ